MKKCKSIKKRSYPKAMTGLEIQAAMTLLSQVTGEEDPIKGIQKLGDKFNLSKQLQALSKTTLGVTNFIENQRVAQEEQDQYIKSIQPRAMFNPNQDGLNNTPVYFEQGGKLKKYQVGALAGLEAGVNAGMATDFAIPDLMNSFGKKEEKEEQPSFDMIGESEDLNFLMDAISMKVGGISPQKAKKILHDGKVHGKKLTPKQRRFFGAMSNMQTGGVSDDIRQEWNNYISWLEQKNMKGKPELDQNQLGFKLLEEYKTFNPKTSLTKEKIPEIQNYLQDYRNWAIDQHKAGKIKLAETPSSDYSNFMPFIYQYEQQGKKWGDGYPGQFTTSVKFPMEYLNDKPKGFADIVQNKQTGGYVENDIVDLSIEEIKKLQQQGYQFEFVDD